MIKGKEYMGMGVGVGSIKDRKEGDGRMKRKVGYGGRGDVVG